MLGCFMNETNWNKRFFINLVLDLPNENTECVFFINPHMVIRGVKVPPDRSFERHF